MKRKTISFLLILCMVLSFVPTAVFGAGRYAVNNTKNATGATILQEARKWANRGAKYWSGTDPWEKSVAWRTGYTVDGQTSFDCSGFVGRILNDAGFRGASYAPSYGNTVLSQNYGRYSIGISIEELVSYGRDLSSAVSKARNGDYSGLQAGDIIGWTSGSLGRHIIIYAGLNSSGRPTMIEFTGSGYLERVVSSSYQNAFQFGARLTEDAGSTGNGTALSLSNGNYPTSIDEGNVFSVTGEITSGSQLTSVTVAVYDMSGTFMTGVQNVNPYSDYYNIRQSADAKVYFNHLSAGTYRYIVSAKNSAGTSKEFINRTFQVIGKTVYHTVTFDANGGTVSPTTRAVADGAVIGTLPTPSRTGYKFERWAEEPNGGFGVSDQRVITKDTTIYAQWSPLSYTITFNANGGKCSTSSITRLYGSALGTLPEATRYGYFFMGWYNGNDRVSSATQVTSNMSLTAKWENGEVTYPVEGGNLYFDKTSGTITNCDQSVTKAVIPAEIQGVTVKAIGTGAFQNCENLISVSIPSTVESIGSTNQIGSFQGCKKLVDVQIAYGVKTIGALAFCNCESLKQVKIPESVTTIMLGTFSGCKSLEEVVIPDSVTNMNIAFSFDECVNLKHIHIGKNLKRNFDTFNSAYELNDCVNLESITVSKGNENYVVKDGVLYSEDETTLIFVSRKQKGEFTVPNTVTSIGQSAFANTQLEILNLPASLDNNIGNIVGPNLKAINVDDNNEKYSSVDGVVFNKSKTELIRYPAKKGGDYIIPSGVASILAYCFSNTNVHSISIPDSVIKIGLAAFRNCKDLETIALPDGITEIPQYLLYKCSSLKSLVVPDGVTRILFNAFDCCSELESIVFPSSIQFISNEAVHDNTNLKYVYFKGTESDWNNITINDGNDLLKSVPIHYQATDHTWLESEMLLNPTCTESGIRSYSCKVCDAEKYEVIPATGHQWNSGKVTKAATCIEEGTKQFTCTACGETRTEPIPVTEHNYTKSETIAPSCTQDGYTKHTCTCGEFYFDNYISALGHTWSIGVVTKQPTETTEGVKTFTCTVCGETRTESIPALSHSHSYTAVVTPPTCTEKGYTTHTCACGDSYVDSYTAPTGHSWGAWSVLKQPTEKAEGERVRVCSKCGAEERESIDKLTPSAPTNPFVDVKQGAYYYDPVLWAINHDPQITNGTSPTTFSPNANCTRGQIVTFLWRAKGQPEPKRTDNPFVDVNPSDYYYKAVLWAVEQEITNGTDATHFSPNASCTRGQAVTFLWRAEGKPAQSGGANSFTDVKPGQYYYDAVLWAVKNGITNGTSATTFSPDATCIRGQIVTFLYRDMA